MMNTFISASISGIVVFSLKPHLMKEYSKVKQYDVG